MRNYFGILFAVLTIVGCEKEKSDDNNTLPAEPVELLELDGSWSLKTFTGGEAGVEENWSEGLIHWTFNNETSEVNVVNNMESSYSFSSGIYPYEIIEDGTDSFLKMSNIDLGKVSIVDDNLIVEGSILPDGTIADAFDMNFEPYYLTQQVWNMTHISGGFSGVYLFFDSGLFTFDFDPFTGTAEIVNSTEEGVFSFNSGIYEYTIEVVDTTQFLVMDVGFSGRLTVSDDQLYINGDYQPGGGGADYFNFVLE